MVTGIRSFPLRIEKLMECYEMDLRLPDVVMVSMFEGEDPIVDVNWAVRKVSE